MHRFTMVLLILGYGCVGADAQFTFTGQTISPGGQSSGGPFSLNSTAGQSSCGSSSGGVFSGSSGYNGGGTCAAALAAPTAARVIVSGQTITSDGRGVKNVVVTLTDGSGQVRSTRTNAFGYFAFEGVLPGSSYVVQASARHYLFSPAIIDPKNNLVTILMQAQ